MSRNKSVCDVFLSYSLADSAVAAKVNQSFSAVGLRVFDPNRVSSSQRIEEQVREAMAESFAIVVIVSPNSVRSANILIEIGAAMAWRKAVHFLLHNIDKSDVPFQLSAYRMTPITHLDEVVLEIRDGQKPISADGRDVLKRLYAEEGVSSDKLAQSVPDLERFTNRFNRKSNRKIAPERILQELLRLRKKGELPRISASGKKRRHSSISLRKVS